MGAGERALYPMLGVGAFFVMFWVGFVVGYELGLSCWLFVLNALFFACSGTWFVVRLESADLYRQLPSPDHVDPGGRTSAPSRSIFRSPPFASTSRSGEA